MRFNLAFLMKCKYIFLASFSFTCHYVDISTIKIDSSDNFSL